MAAGEGSALNMGECLRTYTGHKRSVFDAMFVHGGRQVLSCDGHFHVNSKKTNETALKPRGGGGIIVVGGRIMPPDLPRRPEQVQYCLGWTHAASSSRRCRICQRLASIHRLPHTQSQAGLACPAQCAWPDSRDGSGSDQQRAHCLGHVCRCDLVD